METETKKKKKYRGPGDVVRQDLVLVNGHILVVKIPRWGLRFGTVVNPEEKSTHFNLTFKKPVQVGKITDRLLNAFRNTKLEDLT